jgi:single-stranded-DNA-specific exonuclease
LAESILDRRIEPRWVFAEHPDNDVLSHTKSALNIPTVMAKILINRGILDVEEAKHFLTPALENLLDPFLLKDMDLAVDRIWKAIDAGEKIMVHGDYDADGVTGTSVLIRTLSFLGADITFYIPHRLEQGYGISHQGIDRGITHGVTLLISVDCGITAIDEVIYAKKQGMDVVITDHHEPGSLPEAVAVINPKRNDCTYPFKELPGVALAFKLAEAIYRKRDKDLAPVYENLDLVALGCAADIVPLVEENRIFVMHGLIRLRDTANQGLKALLKNVGLWGQTLGTSQLIFILAPRINALGRLDSAMGAVAMLTTDVEEEARNIAKMLEDQNMKRREIDSQMLSEALSLVEEQVDIIKDRAVVLASASWHPGVIGIVATRIAEKVHLPTVLISLDGESGKGFARSIPSFDLFQALSLCREHVTAFGGHKYAAGLTIAVEKVDAFREHFLRVAKELSHPEDMVHCIDIESELSLDQIDLRLVNVLKRFAPFGPQNLRPVMVSRNVEVVGAPSQVGNNHLRFNARQNGRVFDCIGFNLGHLAYRLTPGESNLDMA